MHRDCDQEVAAAWGRRSRVQISQKLALSEIFIRRLPSPAPDCILRVLCGVLALAPRYLRLSADANSAPVARDELTISLSLLPESIRVRAAPDSLFPGMEIVSARLFSTPVGSIGNLIKRLLDGD